MYHSSGLGVDNRKCEVVRGWGLGMRLGNMHTWKYVGTPKPGGGGARSPFPPQKFFNNYYYRRTIIVIITYHNVNAAGDDLYQKIPPRLISLRAIQSLPSSLKVRSGL